MGFESGNPSDAVGRNVSALGRTGYADAPEFHDGSSNTFVWNRAKVVWSARPVGNLNLRGALQVRGRLGPWVLTRLD